MATTLEQQIVTLKELTLTFMPLKFIPKIPKSQTDLGAELKMLQKLTDEINKDAEDVRRLNGCQKSTNKK